MMAVNRSRVRRASEEAQDRAHELRRRMTIPERALWNLMRGKRLGGFKFRRQAPIGPFIVDYYCPECWLVVELDGMTHVGRATQDAQRTAYLETKGLRVIRVTNDDVLQQPEAVQRFILQACREQAARLNPPA